MSRTVLAVVAVAVLLSGASACTQYIKSCTEAGWIASGVDIYTEPAWETLTVGDSYVSYTTMVLSKAITGGKLHEKATLSGIVVKDETTDLCKDLAESDMPCPAAVGDHTMVGKEVTIGSIPAGELKGTIQWYDAAGNGILCIESVMCVE